MPALTSITVQDRETVPVDHVYVPSTPDGDIKKWRVSDGVPFGDETLNMSSRVTGNGVYKSQISMEDPVIVTETINGVDRSTKERFGSVTTTYMFSKDSTEQERANLVGKHHNLTNPSQTFVNDVIVGLEGMY